ncbi:glycoside hydrolase [Flavobacteriaceae bacterium R38]|nr:glycoside hydrolase [Flavobacteriaceae bacterium R38]
MKKIKLLIFFILTLGISSLQSQSSKINGISFVGGRNVVNKNSILPVVNVNANWVTLMPLGFMRGLQSPEVRFNQDRQWWGERKIGVKTTAALFREQKVNIMIKPQIWISRGEFTGRINMETEEDWKAFEKSYEQFIIAFATLAQEVDAKLFCIGTELNSFVSARPDFWKQLISKVKKVYKGKITYAENWDAFTNVPFWNRLDYIGIDAYFPLNDAQTPKVEDLKNGWSQHKAKIKALHLSQKKPILFTEYGYRSVDYTARQPWNSDRSLTNVNLKAQENALLAIYEAFWKEDWFAGGFLWKWYDFHNRAGGKENSRFTPQNKPAEKLIKEFYRIYK